MRKIIALLLLAAISMTILSGCGGDKYVKSAKAGPLVNYEYGGNIEKGLKDYITGNGATGYKASWKTGDSASSGDITATGVQATITYTYEGEKQELVLFFSIMELGYSTLIASNGVYVDGENYDDVDFWDEVFG